MFLLHGVFTTTDLCIFCKLGIGITHFCQPKLKDQSFIILLLLLFVFSLLYLGFPSSFGHIFSFVGPGVWLGRIWNYSKP